MSRLSWRWPDLNPDMTLDELISPIHGRLGVLERTGDQRVTITDLTNDSRKVGPGSLFVAVPGERVDGHQYLDSVVAAGAAAVVEEAAETAAFSSRIRVARAQLAATEAEAALAAAEDGAAGAQSACTCTGQGRFAWSTVV